MLRYPCLVLDHDDTVVRSEDTINYPFFCLFLREHRPGVTVSLAEYTDGCFREGFAQMCRSRYGFTDRELQQELEGWKRYLRTHTPPPFPGMDRVIRRQRALSGLLCVVSHSSRENITRDYQTHFGLLPDEIFGWDEPEDQRKPSPYPLEQIMARYHLDRSQLLVVDDMRPAWEMASRAGVVIGFAAWGRTHYPQIQKEMRALCDFTFESPEMLEHFLFDPLTTMV